ncbi:MAG: hypothetical protein ACJATI_001573 [Halioglobus sp.]|jgi:uncharacterized protein (TIGR02452 family)
MDKKRNKNKSIADETLEIMEKRYFTNSVGSEISIDKQLQDSILGTICYSPNMSDKLLDIERIKGDRLETKISVTSESTLDCVRRLKREGKERVLCLNFASARNPGGGFLGGSQAQEESIARASGLYPSLLGCTEYYETNRKQKSCFYTDYMIYTPQTPIFKKENGENMDQLICASVITAPAVNSGVVVHREPERIKEIETVMTRRISKVLSISYANNHKVLVLGAWGCGVFRNDPIDMARYFREVIETDFKNVFEEIVFAVYSRNEKFITPFIKEFTNNKNENNKIL